MADFEMVSGDSRDILINVSDQDGAPIDLTSATLTWECAPVSSSAATLTKTLGDGVVIQTPSGGSVPSRMVVSIDAGDIPEANIDMIFWHQAKVTKDGKLVTVLDSTFGVKRSL